MDFEPLVLQRAAFFSSLFLDSEKKIRVAQSVTLLRPCRLKISTRRIASNLLITMLSSGLFLGLSPGLSLGQSGTAYAQGN